MPQRRDLANAVRALSMDAVQKANSGHPGMPMGMADIAEVLWNDYLRHNPGNPRWENRDRFVLSNGHGSMLLYSVLYLSGYPLGIEQIRNFRQLGYHTAGHPEYDQDLGIETTTGPLGQGITNAIGMALAEKVLAAQFNKPGYDLVDHHTYVFIGDGCLMEGISHEACSLAGTLRLGKLIVFYDDNGISIDGKVDGWFTDDTPARFRAYGWHVVADVDGHNPAAVAKAIDAARSSDRPSLICCKTVIGWGSPNKQGSEATHGAPLGDEEVVLVRETIGWPHPPFEVPDDIRAGWDATKKGAKLDEEWQQMYADYRQKHPQLGAEFKRRMAGELPDNWQEFAAGVVKEINAEAADMATRKASLRALNGFAPVLPELLGGSADLTGSNLTFWDRSKTISAEDASGNYLYYGVREFCMSAMMNGMALHGGVMPYGATFLTFSDYARNAVRMAALIKAHSIFVYTHDSIGLGEDGPTHQAIEHVASLRLIPGMIVWRPCDSVESAIAWQAAIERRDGPTCLLFTRQGVPFQNRDVERIENIRRGGYVLRDCEGTPTLILIATGSEVAVAMDAVDELEKSGVSTRVVSMPSTDVFEDQDDAYRDSVLPADVSARVVIEAGVSNCWHRYAGPSGRIIGMDRFGLSAPAGLLFEKFGFTADNIIKVAREIL
ncbi:MAG: transketolase [Gammaproteobacteria bacterium]|nr:transketolase [Gammaproteobacteria bacterium]MCZ6715891.1 transketolase [Gammaproteobacteria bacterium]